jgi:hypothetical protein
MRSDVNLRQQGLKLPAGDADIRGHRNDSFALLSLINFIEKSRRFILDFGPT